MLEKSYAIIMPTGKSTKKLEKLLEYQKNSYKPLLG